MLGFGRIELIFFIGDCMVLCFGFVMRTALMTQGCFSYCWTALAQHQGLSCFSACLASEQARDAQEAGRRHSRDSWPQL